MARSCYIYNKLKIPGPNGIITIHGDFKKAKECELGNARLAEAVLHAQELDEMRKDFDPKEMPVGPKPPSGTDIKFKPGEHTKKQRLDNEDASKVTTIGTGLDDK